VFTFLTVFCVSLFDLEGLMEKVVVVDHLQCHIAVVVVDRLQCRAAVVVMVWPHLVPARGLPSYPLFLSHL
jgi:hypothetical protein